jgi:hypothetical protein
LRDKNLKNINISEAFEALEKINEPILKFLWSKYLITKPIPRVRVVGIPQEWIFSRLWEFLKNNVLMVTSEVEYRKESFDEIKTEAPFGFVLEVKQELLDLLQKHKADIWRYLTNYDYVIFLNIEKIRANAQFNKVPEYRGIVLELLHEDVHIVEYYIGERIIKNYDTKYFQPEIIFKLEQEFWNWGKSYS